ncbi:MAG: hypothetical protein AAF756_04670 [Pseudomonadota bacterium]
MTLRPIVLELRRRRVFRAAAIYTAGSWAFVQVVSLILPAIGAPDNALAYAWLLVLALAPLVVFLAWRYEISLDGISKTPPATDLEDFDASLKPADFAILALVLVISVSTGWQLTTQVETSIDFNLGPIDRYSVAVLPMIEVGATDDKQYLAQGMQASLIAALCQVQRLRVTSKISTLQYAGTQAASMREIGETLRVEKVVEGTVTRNGERVRVAVQLFDADADKSVWAATFEDNLRNINYLHAKIALEIAKQIKVDLTAEDRTRFQSTRGVNPDAYLAFVRGVFHAEHYNVQELALAEGHFRRAVEIDPAYAQGHWGLAKLCAFRGQSGLIPPSQARAQCRPHIEKALQLDPFLPEAHLGLAALETWQDFNFIAAREHFERAIDLNPSYAEAHMFFSHYLGIMGELSLSSEHMRKALELDPLNSFVQGLYSMQLIMRDDYNRAIEVANHSLQNTDVAFGYVTLSMAHHELGNTAEEIDAFANTLRHVAGKPAIALTVKPMFYALGYEKTMLTFAEQLEKASQSEYVSPLAIGSLYEHAGRIDDAVRWFRKGFELGDPDTPYLGVNMKSPEVRSHPDFVSLLEEMKLDFWVERNRG